MARKRMISPQIWESFSFAELSDLAKILFISLISHADDEGRGIAGAAYIKNITFPHDDTRRVADVQKALSEIALHTSTQFYCVEGRDYYCLMSWNSFQKVEKPSKSKLPPPPSVGEGGTILSTRKTEDNSPNVRGIVGEGSAIKYNINKYKSPPSPPLGGGERDFKGEFFKAYPKLKPVRTDDSFVDYSALLKAFENSECLRTRYSMRWVLENYDAVIRGDFADAESVEGARAARESWYAERRAAAEERAHKALQQALKDKAYAAADGWVRQLAPRIAFEKDEKLAEAMQAQLDDAERAKAERLKELGLDIQVHYHCTKCSDTGFLPNGRPCDCYNKED